MSTKCATSCTGDIVDSVVLCVGVPDEDSDGPIYDWKARGRKDWIDATICELERLTRALETIDNPE